jgi:hypothetical protein
MRRLPSHFNFKSKAHYKQISDIAAEQAVVTEMITAPGSNMCG